MDILLNIVHAALLFCVFLLLVCSPVAPAVRSARSWYSSHRLTRLPWRRRRALLALALLWSAFFSKLSLGKKVAGISAGVLALLVVFLFLLRAMVCSWSLEDSICLDLRVARRAWLEDDCPRPLDPAKYLPQSSSFTGLPYINSLTAKDADSEKRTLGMSKHRTCKGLFAIKEHSSQKTYVIATTGEILSLDTKGAVQLLNLSE